MFNKFDDLQFSEFLIARKDQVQSYPWNNTKSIPPLISKTCDICGAAVIKLKRHKDLVHFKKKPYQCRFCDRCFGTRSNRNSHEKFKHRVGEKKDAS